MKRAHHRRLAVLLRGPGFVTGRLLFPLPSCPSQEELLPGSTAHKVVHNWGLSAGLRLWGNGIGDSLSLVLEGSRAA